MLAAKERGLWTWQAKELLGRPLNKQSLPGNRATQGPMDVRLLSACFLFVCWKPDFLQRLLEASRFDLPSFKMIVFTISSCSLGPDIYNSNTATLCIYSLNTFRVPTVCWTRSPQACNSGESGGKDSQIMYSPDAERNKYLGDARDIKPNSRRVCSAMFS